jgi:hypothetical protein
MNSKRLVDAIVRQTTVLIAEIATAAGIRAPLARVADQVFVQLAREIESQGVGRKVAAEEKLIRDAIERLLADGRLAQRPDSDDAPGFPRPACASACLAAAAEPEPECFGSSNPSPGKPYSVWRRVRRPRVGQQAETRQTRTCVA